MDDKLKFLIPIILFLLVSIMFFGSCGSRYNNVSLEISQANYNKVYETVKPGTFKMSYEHFEGSKNISFNVKKGDKIKFDYDSIVKDGGLSITINDPYGAVVSNLPVNKKGTLKIRASGSGKISIIVVAKNTSGSFKVFWKRVFF